MPWRGSNEFSLLLDGEAFFPAMLGTIERAQREVLVELYLVSSGRLTSLFLDAFCAAAQRGVRVCVLLDGFGARGLTRQDQDRLRGAGVSLALFHPMVWSRPWNWLRRDHRKLMVVDGVEAYVGGLGLTDEFDPDQSSPRHWRETVVRIRGPVLHDWIAVFLRTWRRVTGEMLALPLMAHERAGTQRGRVVISPWRGRRRIRRAALGRIRRAYGRVWLATPYFVPDRGLRRALMRAAARGVDVRLLLPGPHTDHPAVRRVAHWYYARLLRRGVRIFEYQPRFLHAKMLVCDDWVTIGSANFDRWTLRWNLENNQEVDDATFAGQVADTFERDFSSAQEIAYGAWLDRARYARLQEWFWRHAARWIEERVNRRFPRR